jgi:hypothetical protein
MATTTTTTGSARTTTGRQRGEKRRRLEREALARARSSSSLQNESIAIAEFQRRGFSDVRPRENVLTYAAWRAAGRQVRKGEKGVKLTVWIGVGDETDDSGQVVKRGRRFARSTRVFHIDQTDAAAE